MEKGRERERLRRGEREKRIGNNEEKGGRSGGGRPGKGLEAMTVLSHPRRK